jgi:glycosyltransferase involved in cell wall biosynthesis
MLETQPRVTIGVPVYNGVQTMRIALESILTQTYGDFLLMISDNASEDGTREICEEYQKADDRIRYIRQPTNLGVVRNANGLLCRAETEFFMWHAVDDVSLPRMLEACVAAIDERDEAVLAYVQAEPIDETGCTLPSTPHPLDLGSPEVVRRFEACLNPMEYTENVIYGLMRRASVLRTQLHGDFGGGDRALCAELSLYGPFARVNETLFQRRVESQRKSRAEIEFYNTGRNQSVNLREWRILRHNLASVARAPLPTAQRIRLFGALLRRLGRCRFDYLAELKGGVRAVLRI